VARDSTATPLGAGRAFMNATGIHQTVEDCCAELAVILYAIPLPQVARPQAAMRKRPLRAAGLQPSQQTQHAPVDRALPLMTITPGLWTDGRLILRRLDPEP